ncbi:hypothetical protein [Kitasatospora sp. NBC_01266]|uniref:hypothetical protein n=1 Tax=Kitasatospora sp. NBC_01266 TaxID=2903572 RepID=UPI002E37BD90|nr:hypothetical protein [Kitasatospora sp. NBC_01266]
MNTSQPSKPEPVALVLRTPAALFLGAGVDIGSPQRGGRREFVADPPDRMVKGMGGLSGVDAEDFKSSETVVTL